MPGKIFRRTSIGWHRSHRSHHRRLGWGQDNLDPLIKRYVKRYLFDEGFIEQALGMLDPVIDQDITALLEILRDSDF